MVDINDYDWEGDRPLGKSISSSIIYEMHVGGFTKSASSNCKYPGTFTGVIEKIPYLQELGITAVELLPIFDFDEFEGVLLHRDSLGSVQEIHPGAVNWMSAGQGIVHSERSPQSDRDQESTLHAIQTWIALPQEEEETEPWFRHYPTEEIPTWTENGVTITLIAGSAWGRTSPVKTSSRIIYLDLLFAPGAKLTLPPDQDNERAIYTVMEGLLVNGLELKQHQLALLSSEDEIELAANSEARCMIIGGEAMEKRYKWWNFVSSNLARIEQAKYDWRSGKFPQVPGEKEFIPLPDEADLVSKQQKPINK